MSGLAGLDAENFWTWSKTDTTGMMDMITSLRINASNLRGSYGFSWRSACGGSIRVSTRTTWSISEMIL